MEFFCGSPEGRESRSGFEDADSGEGSHLEHQISEADSPTVVNFAFVRVHQVGQVQIRKALTC